MAEELDDLATPELEVDEQVVDQDDSDAPVVDEPFLPVNDRTTYRTREDAIAGFNSAAQRIQELSQWEKQAKQWNLTDPRQLDAVANELLALRKEKAEAAAQAGKRNTATVSDPADPKAKEEAQVREYMKNLGYISKEDQEEALKELREAVAEMRNQGSQSRELGFQAQEADARDAVEKYIAADGFKDPAGTKSNVIGTLIKDWINSSDDRIDEWSKGGRAATALVKQGYDLALSHLEWKPVVGTVQKPADQNYSLDKAKAMARNKKGLPAQGQGKDRDKDGKFTTPKQKGHINAELHERAWKHLQETD
jgi:hypothetical protein